MKRTLLLFVILLATAHVSSAQTVWKTSNGTTTFTKAANADWTLAANQDRITDSVWITRASNQSLFNIRKENTSSSTAPAGTLWAFGTTDSFATLTYKTFTLLSNSDPQSLIGKNLVLKLTAHNIYIDLKITTFGGGGSGGAVSYTRAVAPTTSVDPVVSPIVFELQQNFPNPFNPETEIRYQLSENGSVTLTVFDALGREVETLVNEVKDAGVHSVRFNAAKLSSGTYFARLTSGGKTQLKKMSLMK